MERQIPDNCLGNTVNARCVKTEVSIPDLDIQSGDNLDWVIEKLANQESVTQETNSDFISGNFYCLGGSGSSVCASQIAVRTMSYSTTIGGSGSVSFSWDLTLIRSSLPSAYSVTSISVVANSPNSVNALLSSSSAKSSVTFNISSYPVTVDFKIRVNTTCGQIELTKTINLYNSADTGNKTAIMDLADYTSNSIQNITQDQYNELVASEICLLKDRVMLIEESFDQSGDISSLSNQLNSVTIINSSGSNQTFSLQEALSDISTRLKSIEDSTAQ